MTLSSTYATIDSGFASIAAQSAIISNNIANVNTTGYVRETANQVSLSYGGSEVLSVNRLTNATLLAQLSSSTSASAAQTALSSGLQTLSQTVSDSSSSTSSSGADQNGASPYAMIGNLQSALATYQSSPSSTAAAQAVLTAASSLATSLNAGSQTVSSVQEQADSDMANSVSTINTLLGEFQTANNTVVAGLTIGANVSQAEDTRDSIVTQLSNQLGVTTSLNSNGSMSIYTDSGLTLFQDTARTVSFTPTTTYVSGTVGNNVTVNGIPITGSSSPMAIQSGALAGYAELRDAVAPEYQAQLDQIAGGLISAFAESDQTGSGATTLPGLFTSSGLTSVPSNTDASGLAASIEINPNVDPSQGGDITLLRDGGIADPGDSAYVYNTTGGASYTGRIDDMISALTTTQTFDSSAGLASSASLSDYASDSVSWLQSQYQTASDAASYQSAVASQATSALSNATGVNLDTEMTNMLSIENSYTSSAKLLSTVNTMFNSLLTAATPTA